MRQDYFLCRNSLMPSDIYLYMNKGKKVPLSFCFSGYMYA